MQSKIFFVSALAGLASALYQADTSKPPSGNAIGNPTNTVVPAGAPYTITWNPTTPGKVSIVLLKGPGNNVQYLSTIADSIANTGSFVWNVDSKLVPQNTGYAIEIISEDHSYQYSTQIGIGKAANAVGGSDPSVTFGAVETAPPTSGAEGTAVCGALDECDSTSYAPVETAPPSSAAQGTAVCGALDECAKTSSAAATGTGNFSSPVVSPTAPLTVPTSLATVAVGGGTKTSVAVIAPSGNAPKASASTSLSSAFGSHNAQLSGVAALVAGFLGFLVL